MRFLRSWGFVPICLGVFFGFIILMGHVSENKRVPEWSPSGDPRDTMSHGDALVCWCYKTGEDRSSENSQAKVDLLVTWMPGAGGDHLILYPSAYGECGILPVSQFSLNPVTARLNPGDTNERHHLCATTWSPSHKPEPYPPYQWTMTELSEDEGGYWMTFVPSSSNVSRPVVEMRVE